jgi:hypothetical protein
MTTSGTNSDITITATAPICFAVDKCDPQRHWRCPA